MEKNNLEKPKEFKPMTLGDYRKILERLENGENISDVLGRERQNADVESDLSTLFGNGLLQYTPAEGEEEELKKLQERAVEITNKIRENS